jgi:hypothetical protein
MERMFTIKTCQGTEVYVWVGGALTRLEDLHELEAPENPGDSQRLQMTERLLESVLSL